MLFNIFYFVFVQFNELLAELEEQRELATNRLTELEKLIREHQEAKKECERLKMDVRIFFKQIFLLIIEFNK